MKKRPDVKLSTNEKIDQQKESYRAQLRVLQMRLIAHGNRFWQLPFSYAGIVALTYGQESIENFGFYPDMVLFIFGLLLIWMLIYSGERYQVTAEYMNTVEKELGILVTTAAHFRGFAPYYLIVVCGITLSAVRLILQVYGESIDWPL